MTIEKLEEMRKAICEKQSSLMYSTTMWFVLITISFFFVPILSFVFFILLFISIFSSLPSSKEKEEYSLAYKEFFVRRELEKIFTNLEYFPKKGIAKEVLEQTNMLNKIDLYKTNDLAIGKYKDIGFSQSDVEAFRKFKMEDYRKEQKIYDYVSMFKGRWIIFEFNKTFKADVLVFQKDVLDKNSINPDLENTNLKKVEMESLEFNNMFDVYAENPVDAFYILTPKIMEIIINLNIKNNGRLMLCFKNNYLHVGINNYIDSFEVTNIYKPINEVDVEVDIYQDIKKITMFVDELDLDNDLFKVGM